MPANFVHLRLHSAYSLAESTLRIKSLSGLIADDHQPAAAITDTNNMFGALEFAQTLIGAGIQPIMGTQLNLEDAQGQGEIVLLAQTDLGYTNLSKLLSKTNMLLKYCPDFVSSRFEPRIIKWFLEKLFLKRSLKIKISL